MSAVYSQQTGLQRNFSRKPDYMDLPTKKTDKLPVEVVDKWIYK